MSESAQSLDKLQKVDLREVWQYEDRNFTPWLAKEENLRLLGESLSIDFELEAQEKYVGPFKADIFCRDSATGDSVVIENQLEKSDHKHLGQLMTYAAGLKDVTTVIWIAESFTEEHRAALDWLNEKSDESVNFFGVEIELWKIGDSNPAPKFNIISKPNNWKKSFTRSASSGNQKDALIYKYWSEFGDYFSAQNTPLKVRAPRAKPYNVMSVGRSGFNLTAEAYSRKKYLWVTLLMRGIDSTAHFNLLHEQKEAIESEFGAALEWHEEPSKKRSRIVVVKNDVDITDNNAWGKQHEWLSHNLVKFYGLFKKRILDLNADDYQTEE